MKISHQKVLIILLFYVDITFSENITIIRSLDKPDKPGDRISWEDCVDLVHIPQSVCHKKKQWYGNFCNASSSSCMLKQVGGEGYYSCPCSKNSATVMYLDNTWTCLENEKARTLLGCQTNNLFEKEEKEHRLRTLTVTNPLRWDWKKTKLNERQANCKVNVSSSWFIGCDGEMVPLERHTSRTADIFRLRWPISSRVKQVYYIKVFEPIDDFLGRVINLGISCPGLPYKERCLLFKLEGSFTCKLSPVSRSRPTSTIVSSTIKPTPISKHTATASSVTPTQATTLPGPGSKQKNEGNSSSSSLGIIAGVTASVTLVLLLIAAIFLYRRRKSRKDATNTGATGQTDKTATPMAKTTKTNSAFQLEEKNGSVTSQDRENPIAPVSNPSYTVPQMQSSEENSQSGGLYAVLDVPEGHNIYGHREVVSQNGLSAEQPVYNVLEDLSVKDSKETSYHGPYHPEPVYNALEDPYAEVPEEPAWYGSTPVDDPVYNTLEDPDQYTGSEPVYNVLEEPGQSGAGEDDSYGTSSLQDPVYNFLEGPDPESSENGEECRDTVNTNIPVYAVVDKKKKTKR